MSRTGPERPVMKTDEFAEIDSSRRAIGHCRGLSRGTARTPARHRWPNGSCSTPRPGSARKARRRCGWSVSPNPHCSASEPRRPHPRASTAAGSPRPRWCRWGSAQPAEERKGELRRQLIMATAPIMSASMHLHLCCPSCSTTHIPPTPRAHAPGGSVCGSPPVVSCGGGVAALVPPAQTLGRILSAPPPGGGRCT